MRIVQSKADAHSRRYSSLLHGIATKCMRKATASRPTASELLRDAELSRNADLLGLGHLVPPQVKVAQDAERPGTV
eukprot:CAMPEP_0174838830 /NCGR_PEP_ID=MMETSP1114-20130205/7652_1 /TAXON_ID=312471 /ORGANISM="Neobodo designis, Strain CCAP 1951/1" /LENGTH=75 /DNA_ID=CAMNT_0016072941 /DNA_START=13 /DNA_END=236 /DNA_ORIENTATION=+